MQQQLQQECQTVTNPLLCLPGRRFGYDKQGYNKEGYDKQGYNRFGKRAQHSSTENNVSIAAGTQRVKLMARTAQQQRRPQRDEHKFVDFKTSQKPRRPGAPSPEEPHEERARDERDEREHQRESPREEWEDREANVPPPTRRRFLDDHEPADRCVYAMHVHMS